MAKRRTWLTTLATCAPVVFTLDWLVLGWSHAGYSVRAETISALSAYDAPGWRIMAAGQLLLAAGFLACAILAVSALALRGALPGLFFSLAAAGTVQASFARTICTSTNLAWCPALPRSAHGWAQWLHGVGAGLSFTALLLACFAMAWATYGINKMRDLYICSILAGVVATPHVLWFLHNVGTRWHGWSEKVFLATLAAWSAFAGYRLGREAGSG